MKPRIVVIDGKRKPLRPHSMGRREKFIHEYLKQMDSYVEHLRRRGLKVIVHED